MLKALVQASTMFTTGDVVRLIGSIIVFVVCALFLRRKSAAAAWFLFMGSLAYAAKQLFWDFMLVLMFYRAEHSSSSFAWIFFPTGTNAPWTGTLDSALFYSGILLFSVGILLLGVDAIRSHLTKRSSQPLAD